MKNVKVISICLIFFFLFSCREKKMENKNVIFPVLIDGKYGFINREGKLVIEPQFEWAWKSSEGLAPVRFSEDRKGKYGYIDTTGKLIIDTIYDWAGGFREGKGLIKFEDKCGFIDKMGNYIIKPKSAESMGNFKDGYAQIKIKSKWGFINKKGDIVIEPKFDWVWAFDNGIARVEIKGIAGYIDTTGEYIWVPQR